MNAFFALVHKDLLQYLGNRRALLIGLLAPILIAAFFGSLFGGSGANSAPSRVPVGWVDPDPSPLSRRVALVLAQDPHIQLEPLSEADARKRVQEGKLRAALVLPPDFESHTVRALFGAAAPPQITCYSDPSQGATLALVKGVLTQHLMAEVSRVALDTQSASWLRLRDALSRDPRMAAEDRTDWQRLMDSAAQLQARHTAASAAPNSVLGGGGLRPPFSLQDREAVADGAGRGYNGYAHAFAGMGVQFILMLGVDLAVGLLLMRRQDLWKRLRAAPLSRGLLLGSRLLSTALIALGTFVVIMAVGIAVFGVRIQGSGLGFGLILVAFSLLTASFGLMVAALGRSPEATRGLAILATLLLVMLGGAWVPSVVFPDWMQTVTLLTPTRWAVDGLDAMTWRGQGLDAAWPVVGVLLGFSTLMAVVAWWRFDWEEA
ncbi:ABC transporter permease [Inhella gelatinilytica]|uniref:ABC-2 transporter permease n=1 Tax=Inhella gelatinilytica TaxID=2795030 RepID=A0A931IWY3_9BURK|nr:ABC transporter permease [Inhella gelatinilytica]MBH9553674.1 ABC-2 transporter permease [Inhella gelatinilytica]